jgi:hypothetical protein
VLKLGCQLFEPQTTGMHHRVELSDVYHGRARIDRLVYVRRVARCERADG